MSEPHGWQVPGALTGPDEAYGSTPTTPGTGGPGAPTPPSTPEAPAGPGPRGLPTALPQASPGYPAPSAFPAASPPGYGSGYGYAAAQPGIVPLRPLDLGSILGGAFRILRFNPRATIVFSVVINLVALAVALPAVLWALPSMTGAIAADDDGGATTSSIASNAGQGAMWLAATAATLVLAVVTSRAVLGERIRLGDAWRQARPSLWRFIGLLLAFAAMTVAAVGIAIGIGFLMLPLGIVLGVVFLVASAFLSIRWSLAGNALVLERLGVVESLRRSWALTRGQFWRILGITLVGGLVTSILSSVITFPVAVAAFLVELATDTGDAQGPLVTVVTVVTLAATALASALVTPVSSAITTLLYVDQRMRKEGFDVTLAQAAAARAPQER